MNEIPPRDTRTLSKPILGISEDKDKEFIYINDKKYRFMDYKMINTHNWIILCWAKNGLYSFFSYLNPICFEASYDEEGIIKYDPTDCQCKGRIICDELA